MVIAAKPPLRRRLNGNQADREESHMNTITPAIIDAIVICSVFAVATAAWLAIVLAIVNIPC